jgi:cytochrome c oxidase subunit 3
MVWFIGTEVMFFAAFFGALFYVPGHLGADLAGMDHGFTLVAGLHRRLADQRPQGRQLHPDGCLGHSGHQHRPAAHLRRVTVTWAHWGLMRASAASSTSAWPRRCCSGCFLGFQAYEYHHAYTELGLTMGAGAYGATFFMLTGFHGFHVTLGTIMLAWSSCCAA